MELIKTKDSRSKVLMLRVTPLEALDLVISLARQVRERDGNTHRLESYLKDGSYFSIAVHEEQK